MSKFGGKVSNGNGGGSYEIPEEDTHTAVVIALVDLGTQRETFKEQTTERHKIYVAYELVESQDSKGNNFVVGYALTLSTNEKATLRIHAEKILRKTYKDGDDISFDDLLGKQCLVTIEHQQSASGKTYYKIKDVAGLPKNMQGKVPAASHKPLIWSFDDFETDELAPIKAASHLPYLYGESLDKVIEKALDYPGRSVEVGAGPTKEDPF